MRLLLAILLTLAAEAQTETGQISGYVSGDRGQPLASAALTLTSTSHSFTLTAETSGRGAYIFVGLLAGDYTIAIVAQGFTPVTRAVAVHVGSGASENFRLDRVEAASTKPHGAAQLVTQQEVSDLPNLSRNPLWFVGLDGNLSDAGMGTRGAGFAINGQRESSTNVMVDGENNNNEFFGAIGQQLPLAAVQEISLLSGYYPAEYGRAGGGIVNVATRSGTDRFHIAAYEYLRSSALNSNTFEANAEGLSRPVSNRNDFGYSVGGPLFRKKLFFFNNTELTTVRSESTVFASVPSAQLLAETPANTQAFFQSLGQLRPGAAIVGSTTLNSLTASNGANPCTGLLCGTLSPSLPILLQVAYRVPTYSVGGWPGNAIRTFGRIDYNVSASTRLYWRYALYLESDPAGSFSNSPYSGYDLGRSQAQNTSAISLLHAWNPRWNSETSLGFSRLGLWEQGLTSRGLVPSMYANPYSPVTIGASSLALPGYDPFSPGGSGAFGGPENQIQINHQTSWTKGNHLFRFGGSVNTIRDNITDASYQTASASLSGGGGLGSALNGLLSGNFQHFQIAIDPMGYPCPNGTPTPQCSVTLPASAPDFSRSDIYNDGSLYGEDSWRILRHLTIDLGLRWEHFGVQHDRNPNLDSNWYAPAADPANGNLAAYLRDGSLELASKSSIGGLYRPDWKDWAPRAGIAWDLFGNGSTVIRGGYGIGYERNFDNVTFNVMQNAPNYAVLDVPTPISTANFGALAQVGSLPIPQLGARIVNPDLKTAYARFWSVSVERKIGRALVYAGQYSGSQGINLYSISYPNQEGFGNRLLGDPCVGIGDCASQPNSNYSEDVGYRSNQGFSNYQGVSNTFLFRNLFGLGISLQANYTWSHAIDNLSSTFFEAGGQGVVSQYGDRNITINNGYFDAGLLDPYNPNLDKGDAEFDVRHRVVASAQWDLPSPWHSGRMRAVTKGWTLSVIFLARSGQPFSVFDSSQQTLDLSAPRAAFTGSHPTKRNTYVASAAPDLFHLITFLPSQIDRTPNPLTPGAQWPADMSGRDSFRAPGFWNLDVGIHKNTRLRDRYVLQIRGDFYNLLNHANLYIIGTSADLGAGNYVNGCYGCTGSTYDQRQIQLSVRVGF